MSDHGKYGFKPIKLKKYVELHLRSNRGESAHELKQRLRHALDAFHSGRRCDCGNPIWVIGSAVAGFACFSCITGEAVPDNDYEIDEASGLPRSAHAADRPRAASPA